jgi:hypothetical protein
MNAAASDGSLLHAQPSYSSLRTLHSEGNVAATGFPDDRPGLRRLCLLPED